MEDLNSIDTWEEFEKLIAQRAVGSPSEVAYFFRGESKLSQDLKPSLLRRVPSALSQSRNKVLEIEEFLRKQFMSQAELHAHPVEISQRHDRLAWWAVMQHYGAPTRILDWTLSPYVALYFAVSKDYDQQGKIWVLSYLHLLDSMRKLCPDKPTGPDLSVEKVDEFFKEMQSTPFVFLYERIRKNPRMIAQQHAFTVSTDVLLDYSTLETSKGLLEGFAINNRAKKHLLYRLWRMNITANSLFPGLDGVGRHVGELADLELATAAGELQRPYGLTRA